MLDDLEVDSLDDPDDDYDLSPDLQQDLEKDTLFNKISTKLAQIATNVMLCKQVPNIYENLV
jgi:hypothetical protein